MDTTVLMPLRGTRGVRLGLITWDDRSPTGGNIYNAALVEALRVSGVAARLVRVGSGWPDGAAGDRVRLRAALAQWPISLVDGIVAGNAPEEIAGAVAAGTRVAVLVHLPLADEVGLPDERARSFLERERTALAAAHAVFCPSRHTAATLAERYGRVHAIVVPPGVVVAPIAGGSRPPQLLCLGAVTPTKNQLGLLTALAQLRDLEWGASIVGSTAADPAYAAAVAEAVRGFHGRVRITGTVTGAALDGTWAATDLLVSTSRAETYGLAVAEALAHGIPAVVPAGTGAVEALGRVDGLPPGQPVEPDGLAEVLRGWLTAPELRTEWRRRAALRRRSLPTWPDAAAIVRAAVLPGKR